MSGPALRNVDSHAAIHDAALNEAIELNEILDNLLRTKQFDKGLETAYVAVEHWETRTLRHAQAEERGLYKDMLEENPELKDKIVSLIRDHDILRFIVKEIKKILNKDGFNAEVMEHFHSLIVVDRYHNLEEEKILPDH